MVIHGTESKLLTDDTVEKMKTRGPGIHKLLQVKDVGHAPSLMVDDQVDTIKEFLLEN